MGGESQDPTVIHSSSIALLQERFRQLQRVKEMREERELLRILKEPGRFSHAMHFEPSRLFFHPELTLPPRPPPQVSLSLWPNLHTEHDNIRCTETPLLTNLRPSDTPFVRPSSNKFDDHSDVDTSLHL